MLRRQCKLTGYGKDYKKWICKGIDKAGKGDEVCLP